MSMHDAALALIVLSELKKRIAAADKEVRGDTGMVRGDRAAVRHPLDPSIKLGSVTMTDPAPTAKVTDRDAFTAWMVESYPESCEQVERITGRDAEVMQVLRRHAPHLLATVTEVPDYTAAEVLRRSEKAGEPVGPGGELDVPGVEVTASAPVLQVRPTADAAAAVAELWRSGRLNLDGTLALPGAHHAA